MITIQDIAKKAGVNKCTVSSVLNGKAKKARISEKTCEKVLSITKQMGYQRNELARSVATGKSNVIAFVSHDTGTFEYIGKIMSGILEEISRHGYSLKVYNLSGENSSDIGEKIIQQRVDGVIFHAVENADFQVIRTVMSENHIPCAVVNLSSQHSDLGVTSDDFQGTKEAVKHLAKLGHKRISYISHQSVARSTEYIANREAGYIAGMKEFIGKDVQTRIEKMKIDILLNEAKLKSILDVPVASRPTGLICISDTLAMGFMQIAYQLGIKLPEELSIVGCADLEMAKCAMVPLTTIAQPFEEMGKETAKMLLNIVSREVTGNSNATNKILPVKLIVRNSTAPVKI